MRICLAFLALVSLWSAEPSPPVPAAPPTIVPTASRLVLVTPSLPIWIKSLDQSPLGSLVSRPWFAPMTEKFTNTMRTAGDRFPLHRFLSNVGPLAVGVYLDRVYVEIGTEQMADLVTMAQAALPKHSVDTAIWHDATALVLAEPQGRTACVFGTDAGLASARTIQPLPYIPPPGALAGISMDLGLQFPMLSGSRLTGVLARDGAYLTEHWDITPAVPLASATMAGTVTSDDFTVLPDDTVWALVYKRPPMDDAAQSHVERAAQDTLSSLGLPQGAQIAELTKSITGFTLVVRTKPQQPPCVEMTIGVKPEAAMMVLGLATGMGPAKRLDDGAISVTMGGTQVTIEADDVIGGLRLSTARWPRTPGFGSSKTVQFALQRIPRDAIAAVVSKPGPVWGSVLAFLRDPMVSAGISPDIIGQASEDMTHLDIPGVCSISVRDGKIHGEALGLFGGPLSTWIAVETFKGYTGLVDGIVAKAYAKKHGVVPKAAPRNYASEGGIPLPVPSLRPTDPK